jgi:hypothetical protein
LPLPVPDDLVADPVSVPAPVSIEPVASDSTPVPLAPDPVSLLSVSLLATP